jgi:hypothetical protein
VLLSFKDGAGAALYGAAFRPVKRLAYPILADMRKLLLAGLLLSGLAGCAGIADHSGIMHASVTAYVKKTLQDPASYQPVRWGNEVPLDKKRVNYLFNEYQRQYQLAAAVRQRLQRRSYQDSAAHSGFATLIDNQTESYAHILRAQALNRIINKIVSSPDTTKVGTLLTHVYLYKNHNKTLTLDSAAFVVYKTGSVQRF